ncbi:hypothetical protein [Cobetia sp. ICG0124]|uniref:hypothetical protein n=1 Tax=Cobetia sp. ICG0124 TaxID=2053669 RepID=UPI00196AA5E0|nr:hypothetical protein [Cobetia sp. ICG0124]
MPFSTVAVTVCSLPLLSVMTSVTVLPSSASVVPTMVGVVSEVSAGASTVRARSRLASISPTSLLVAVLPAGSVTVASTLYSPSLSGVSASTL